MLSGLFHNTEGFQSSFTISQLWVGDKRDVADGAEQFIINNFSVHFTSLYELYVKKNHDFLKFTHFSLQVSDFV